mgnify:CR=1 FL=1
MLAANAHDKSSVQCQKQSLVVEPEQPKLVIESKTQSHVNSITIDVVTRSGSALSTFGLFKKEETQTSDRPKRHKKARLLSVEAALIVELESKPSSFYPQTRAYTSR